MGRRISGDGPIPAQVMLVGQRPGREEINRGRPFVGKSGQELDRYLANDAGLSRSGVFVTNLVRDYDGDDEITPEEIARDWPELMAEMEMVKPVYVGLVGLYAARAILKSVPNLDLDWSHGLQFVVKLAPSLPTMLVMPIIHPAAGLHQSGTAIKIAWDFQQFGKLVRGESLPTAHLTPPPPGQYRQCRTSGDVSITAGVDTEGSVSNPWCVSYSTEAGFGMVDRSMATTFSGLAVLHNAIHDLPMVKVDKFTDTMLMAGLLGVEPLSLKALARRHCGLIMREYADVVAPAQREKALEYLAKVYDHGS